MGMLKKVSSEQGPMVKSNLLKRVRVFHGREVPQRFPEVLLPEQTANNLATLRFGKLAHAAYRLRLESRAEALDQVPGKLLLQSGSGRGAGLEYDECDNAPAFQRVGNADDGGFGNCRMLDESVFHFRRTHLAPGHVHGFIRASMQKPAAVFIHAGPVAVIPPARPARPVSFDVALGIAPDASRHRRRWFCADQITLRAPDRPPRVIDNFRRHTRRRAAQRTGFERLDRQW